MIVYGTKTTETATENLADKCTSCGTPFSIKMSVFQKYAHVFWIPFFPMGKIGVTECSHCKQVLENKEFSGNLKEAFESLKTRSKTPPWTFAGLAILGVLIIWGVVTSKQKDERNAQLISTPQKGDVYEIKIAYKQYTLYKVDTVISDTAFLLINEFETDKVTGLLDLKNKAYQEGFLPMATRDLKIMLDKGEIIDIERK